MKIEDFLDLKLSFKDLAIINNSFNKVKRKRKKYIIYPPFFERKYGFRIRKWDSNAENYIIVPVKRMTGEELEMVRLADFKKYGKVFN